ncbi:MAG: M24 family metallopeptidase [Candidatus Hodarchaeota archaeon]
MYNKSEELFQLMEKLDLDALILTDPTSIQYFSGFLTVFSRFMALIIKKDGDNIFIVPKIEEGFARSTNLFSNIKIYIEYPGYQTRDPFDLIKKNIIDLKLCKKRIGIESTNLVQKTYNQLNNVLNQMNLIDITDNIEKIKMIKSKDELDYIRKAVKISEVGLKAAIKSTKIGATEVEVACAGRLAIIQEIADNYPENRIETHFNINSGTDTAFAHRKISGKRIIPNELVYHVWCNSFEGYFDELARTIFTGKPTEKHLDIFTVVLEAHNKAISSLKPGVKASEIDRKARAVIAEAGYGEFNPFYVGHSLGLKSKERPFLKVEDDTKLKPGMVVSIEPGIYIPGFGGIGGNSDTIFITKEGHEVVTTYPKTLSPDDLEM